MDAFFVSAELVRRPELIGKPVVVGGAGNRGVVAAASYEARSFGIHSAMPAFRAKKLCLGGNFFLPETIHITQQLVTRSCNFSIGYTPLVEPISLDEASFGCRRQSATLWNSC